jgi:peroxiredoxin
MKKERGPRILAAKFWFPLTGGVLAVGLLILLFSRIPTERTSGGLIPSPREGFAAPDFQLNTLEGETIQLSDLRGQPVVVNLWASWCPPCKAEMPALQSVYAETQEDGLQVLAVNMSYQDSVREAERFIQENGLDFTVPLDESGEVARLYQMQALPSTYFIDSKGVIQRVIIGGPMSETTIRTSVEQIIDSDQ